MAPVVFVATSAPSGWQLGRWAQKSETIWEEQKLGTPGASYQFELVSGPSSPESSTIKLRMSGTNTEALLLERTVQIFVEGQYFGEYCGSWMYDDGNNNAPPPPLPLGRGAPDAGPAQLPGQKAAPPPPGPGAAPQPAPGAQRAAPPGPQPGFAAQPAPGAAGFRNSGPQQAYAAPQQAYAAPQQAYAAPQQAYGAPQQAYGAPQQAYGAPQPAPGAQWAAPPGPQPGFAAQPAPGGPMAAPARGAALRNSQPLVHPAAAAAAAAPLRPQKAANLDRSPAVVTQLLKAAMSGDAPGAKRLLDANADPDAAGVDGNTPLLAAANKGSVPVVEVLLAAGADPNLGKDTNTPMTVAFQKGNKEVLRALFSAAFQNLESAVGPGAPASPQGGSPYAAAVVDDEVPATAIYELREVTAKLAEVSKTQGRGGFAPGELDEAPMPATTVDPQKMQEEAIRGVMGTIVRATE